MRKFVTIILMLLGLFNLITPYSCPTTLTSAETSLTSPKSQHEKVKTTSSSHHQECDRHSDGHGCHQCHFGHCGMIDDQTVTTPLNTADETLPIPLSLALKSYNATLFRPPIV